MEGPVLLPAAWLFAMGCAWVYRRNERVGLPSPELEAFCRTEPALVLLTLRPRAAAPLMTTLSNELGPKKRIVATLGPPPMPYYELTLEPRARGPSIALVVREAKRLRAHVTPRPVLSVLRSALEKHESEIERLWLDERLFQDTVGERAAPWGWRVQIAEKRWSLAPADETPVSALAASSQNETDDR